MSAKGAKILSHKVRKHVLDMISEGGSSHLASVFSVVDVLSVLYSGILNINPKKPNDPKRDRFILSKGHAGSGIYAILAEKGFIPLKRLQRHYKNGSVMSGHVSHKGIAGVEFSTGSLGHGLSVATGIAKAAKLDKQVHKTFVVASDGECQEGPTWEAILFAAHHKLDNLILIVDYNKTQCIGLVKEVINIEPLRDKFESFGWAVLEADGHNHDDLYKKLSKVPFQKGKPSVLIAHTTRAKGIKFMENDPILWYFRCPQGEEYERAKSELDNKKI